MSLYAIRTGGEWVDFSGKYRNDITVAHTLLLPKRRDLYAYCLNEKTNVREHDVPRAKTVLLYAYRYDNYTNKRRLVFAFNAENRIN